MRDFLGSQMVKNLPYNAGDTGSIPGWVTKLPRASEQLKAPVPQTENPCASTKDLTRHNRNPDLEPNLDLMWPNK